jgi:SAM-dependent methyltransferase
MSTKTTQGKLWSIAPEYWSKHFEPFFLPLYKKAFQHLDVSGDTMLPDAGCGSGLFSSMAKQKGVQVIGIDAAPGLLEVARRRNPDTNFMEEDLEAMPFADNSFDVVTGFNSFQYAGNFSNALQEAKRVLKPGGRLVIGIWAKPELSEATTVLKAIGALLPPPPPGIPGPFALSENGVMEGIFESTGLNLLYKAKVPCPFLYHNLGNGIKSFMGTGPAAAALSHASTTVVEDTIKEALQPYRLADDLYFLENNFLLFIVSK